jgi:hypothetical protein
MTFTPGEKLKYTLRWGVIHAGEAELEVLPMETINGVQVYHFAMHARTSPIVDLIYRYRGSADAYVDVNMTGSIKFTRHNTVGTEEADVTVDYDGTQNQAHFHRVTTKQQLFKKKTRINDWKISILPGTLDPLSAFYYTRRLELKENSIIERPVSDGKVCDMARAKVVKKEDIKVGRNKYDTYLVLPDMKKVDDTFKEKKVATASIWISADQFQIPVKFNSKMLVGSFTGELVSVEY